MVGDRRGSLYQRRCGVVSDALSRQPSSSSMSLRRLRLGVAAQASGTSLSDISAFPDVAASRITRRRATATSTPLTRRGAAARSTPLRPSVVASLSWPDRGHHVPALTVIRVEAPGHWNLGTLEPRVSVFLSRSTPRLISIRRNETPRARPCSFILVSVLARRVCRRKRQCTGTWRQPLELIQEGCGQVLISCIFEHCLCSISPNAGFEECAPHSA